MQIYRQRNLQNVKLPNSVLFDFDFTGQESEYPYVDEDDDIFDFDKIVEAVDKES